MVTVLGLSGYGVRTVILIVACGASMVRFSLGRDRAGVRATEPLTVTTV